MRKPATWALIALGVGAVSLMAWLEPAERVGVRIGDRVPDFSAPSLEGEDVALSDLRGQVVLLTVWATWCGPCRVEMPSIESLYQDYGERGFTVAAVSIDAGPRRLAEIEEFRDEYGLSFPILLDPENRITRTLNTIGVPENFVLDREGRIVKRVVGASNWNSEANRTLVEQLLSM